MPLFADNVETPRKTLGAQLMAFVRFAPDKAPACVAMNLDVLAARHS